MEQLLVLRLLIYGIITQVADRDHACGKAGGAGPTSYRRADGITIVCLPLNANATDQMASFGQQGVTLKIMPNQNGGNSIEIGEAIPTKKERKKKKKKLKVEEEPKVETTTTVPVEVAARRPEVKDEEEEEEDDEDKETKNKRNIEPLLPKKVPPKLPKKVDDPAGVEYSPTPPKEAEKGKKREKKDDQEEEEEEKKEEDNSSRDKNEKKEETGDKKPKKRKVKEEQPELSAEKIKKIFDQNLEQNKSEDEDGNEDEIEQYILIRRRKKGNKNSTKNKLNRDLLVPLASTPTTETITLVEDNQSLTVQNKRKSKRRSEKNDEINQKNKHKSNDKLKEIEKYEKKKDEDNDKPVSDDKSHQQDQSNTNKRRRKKKKVNEIDGKKALIQKRDNENNNYKNEDEKEDRKEKISTLSELSRPHHQIFIINVPITNHNSFNTTLMAPETKTGKKEEDNFDAFLKVFNFVEGEKNNNNQVDEKEKEKKIDKRDDSEEHENIKKEKEEKAEKPKPKKKLKNKRKNKVPKKTEESKNEKEEDKHQKAETPSAKKQDVVYDLLVSKNNKKEEDEDRETTTTPKPKIIKKRKKKKIYKEEKKEEDQVKQTKDELERRSDDFEEVKDELEKNKSGEYKIVKITKVTIKQGNNKRDPEIEMHWPKSGQFHHETGFKTEFEFKKETDTGNVDDFEAFFHKNIVGDGKDKENERLKQKVSQLVRDDNYGGRKGEKFNDEVEVKSSKVKQRMPRDSGRAMYRFSKQIHHNDHPWSQLSNPPNRPPINQ